MPIRQPIRKVNRRSRNTSKRDHLLDVRIRTSTARRKRREKIGRWVWSLFLVAILGAGSFFGIRAALNRFFFQNADYTLNRITLNLDNILTREEALDATGLHEGVNIFSVDLAKVEASLAAIPQVGSVQIERELPDHLAVTVTAREPVAWVAAEGETGDPSASEKSLLVDASGFLMRPLHILPEYFHLPAIYGVKSDNIRAGEPLQSEDLRLALQLIDTVARNPQSLLRIRTLDISRGYCIDVLSDRNSRIIFGTSDFDEQLARLQQLLAHCDESGRLLDSVNLMVKRNTPVTFVVAAVPAKDTVHSGTLRSSPSKTRNN
jgi:cell division septal protein FtsQ